MSFIEKWNEIITKLYEQGWGRIEDLKEVLLSSGLSGDELDEAIKVLSNLGYIKWGLTEERLNEKRMFIDAWSVTKKLKKEVELLNPGVARQ